MKAYELRTHLNDLMLETGEGRREILFLTEEGEVFEIQDVNYDPENECFYIGGIIHEES